MFCEMLGQMVERKKCFHKDLSKYGWHSNSSTNKRLNVNSHENHKYVQKIFDQIFPQFWSKLLHGKLNLSVHKS